MSKDLEAEIQAVLAGPDYMDCPAAAGARLKIADCVMRQTIGIRGRNAPGSGFIPYECRECSTGRAAKKKLKEGGDDVMTTKLLEPRQKVGPLFYTHFTAGPAPENEKKLPPAHDLSASSDLGDCDTIIVDFKGSGDLINRFSAEASAAGETPAEHMLWLVRVYVKGLDRSQTDAAAKS